MGRGSYIGGSTIIDTTVKQPAKSHVQAKAFKERLGELKELFIRVQSSESPAVSEIERIKQLLRLVSLNPDNTNPDSELLSSEDYFIELVVKYLRENGYKPPKVWSIEKAYKEREKLSRGKINKPSGDKSRNRSELEEIEAQYKIEAKRLTRTQLMKAIEQLRFLAKSDQSIRYKLWIFQEIYRSDSPAP